MKRRPKKNGGKASKPKPPARRAPAAADAFTQVSLMLVVQEHIRAALRDAEGLSLDMLSKIRDVDGLELKDGLAKLYQLLGDVIGMTVIDEPIRLRIERVLDAKASPPRARGGA